MRVTYLLDESYDSVIVANLLDNLGYEFVDTLHPADLSCPLLNVYLGFVSILTVEEGHNRMRKALPLRGIMAETCRTKNAATM